MTSYFQLYRQTAKPPLVVLILQGVKVTLKRQVAVLAVWRFGDIVGNQAGAYQGFYLYRIEYFLKKTWKLI